MKSTPYWHECKNCHHGIVIDLCDGQEATNKQCPLCETQEALVKGENYVRRRDESHQTSVESLLA